MASATDPTKPADGVLVIKTDLGANLQATKAKTEVLRSGKSDAGRSRTLSEITDAGALAGLDQVGAADIADGAVTEDETTVDVVVTYEPENAISMDTQNHLLTSRNRKASSCTRTTPGISAGTLTLDLESGNIFEIVLTESATSLMLANASALGRARNGTPVPREDATRRADACLARFGEVVRGVPLAVAAAANAIDINAIAPRGGVTTWCGFPGGQDCS